MEKRLSSNCGVTLICHSEAMNLVHPNQIHSFGMTSTCLKPHKSSESQKSSKSQRALLKLSSVRSAKIASSGVKLAYYANLNPITSKASFALLIPIEFQTFSPGL